jgi:RNA polymerase sigma factor (sigma-70 family)
MAHAPPSTLADRPPILRDGPEAPTDAELLGRFVRHHDEAAFAALVRRHGALVLRVGRNVLRDHADAEDALQATFLVLARKAASIRRGQSLASWLHGVALRTALSLRKSSMRRRQHEEHAAARPAESPVTEAGFRELQALLDEEVARLPERCRAAFVLCCLEDRSRAEAARELGCKEGTVCSRLAKARALLQDRLARRGVALSAVLCATALSREALAVPVALATALAKGAPAYRAGRTAAGLSARAALTAQTVLSEMLRARVTVGVLLALLLTAALAGAGAWAFQVGGPSPLAQGKSTPATDPPKAAEVREPRKDALGDPLPERALVRIGTTRLQHRGTIQAVTQSDDGRVLASCSLDQLRVWDAKDGKLLWQFDLPHWGPWALAFSPDGKELAAVARSVDVKQGIGDFFRFGSATGQVLDHHKSRPSDKHILGGVEEVALARRGSGGWQGAQTSGSDIDLFRPDVADDLFLLRGHVGRVMDIAFTRDGQTLVSLGEDGTIRFWNVAEAKEIARVPVPPLTKYGLKGNIACLAVSPDGKRLAVGLPDETTRLLDATGKELHRFANLERADALAFAADGKTLLTGRWFLVQAWDVASGKEVAPVPQGRVPVHFLALAPDGKTVALAGRERVTLADAATGKVLFSADTACRAGVAFVADGKRLAVASGESAIAFWDVAELRAAKQFSAKPAATLLCKSNVVAFALAPDGKRLATAEDKGISRVYDLNTGKVQLTVQAAADGVYAVAWSPDGKLLATMGNTRPGPHYTRPEEQMEWTGQAVRLWNTATGKEVPVGKEVILTCHTATFHPDGKTLAALHLPALAKRPPGGGSKNVDEPLPPVDDRMESVRLWDIGAAREKLRFDDPVRRKLVEKATGFIVGRSSAEPCAFSPDGRLFAAAGPRDIVVYETASGKPRLRLDGHPQGLTSVVFAPDGKTLLSAGADSTVLVWDLTGLRTTGKLAGTADELWQVLAAADTERAGRAVWALADVPAAALKVLRQHLHRVPDNKEHVQKLIADLDDPKFALREKATRELAELGPVIEEALAARLKAAPSLETSKRIQKLLAVIRSAPPTPEQLRLIRAVEVLEAIGAAAREILEDLAAGADRALLTVQAREALARWRLH